jgi:hypothetical protein
VHTVERSVGFVYQKQLQLFLLAAFSESARTAGIAPNDQFAVSMPRYV